MLVWHSDRFLLLNFFFCYLLSACLFSFSSSCFELLKRKRSPSVLCLLCSPEENICRKGWMDINGILAADDGVHCSKLVLGEW